MRTAAKIRASPKRGSGTWDEFLKLQVETLWQVDFFSKMIWTPTGLRQAFVLAFIHVGSRRVFRSPCSFKPDSKWMVRQAHTFIEQAREADLRMEYLIRDRDGMYIQEFDQVFKEIGCRVKRTAPQAPNQNAFIERWVKSIKFENLNIFVVFGKKHFDFLVASYLEYYNEVRPHQAVDNRPLTGKWPEVDKPLSENEKIICHEKSWRFVAALRTGCSLSDFSLLSPEVDQHYLVAACCCAVGRISVELVDLQQPLVSQSDNFLGSICNATSFVTPLFW